MKNVNRRYFLKLSGLTALPALLPSVTQASDFPAPAPNDLYVRFSGDGEMYSPATYLEKLQAIQNAKAIERDFYGEGGAVAALQQKMEALTGKEKAIFMPTGTMANQMAIAALSGENTKVYVQDTSHVYRDEADAAQSVFNKRLMPLAKDKTYFTADELKNAIESLKQQEVFESGIGAVSIENPVRRTKGCFVPLEEIKKISAYCRSNNIKLHLDGARIYLASAWSGVSIKEYASYFDTIYISLYKYLGAASGAILCGEKVLIDKMPHLIKIHGGAMFSNWANAAMALQRMEGMETLLQNARKRGDEVVSGLNRISGIKVTPLQEGTNIYDLQVDKSIDIKKMEATLTSEFKIRMPRLGEDGKGTLSVNETILYQDAVYIVNAFKKCIA
ncbi:hypothetical protein WSM22_30360 [Cytophagales bacterium WSM2-2]|nr:hypothetical protein WSM22_30360 [Cytophagales bacterium WSM2-2]